MRFVSLFHVYINLFNNKWKRSNAANQKKNLIYLDFPFHHIPSLRLVYVHSFKKNITKSIKKFCVFYNYKGTKTKQSNRLSPSASRLLVFNVNVAKTEYIHRPTRAFFLNTKFYFNSVRKGPIFYFFWGGVVQGGSVIYSSTLFSRQSSAGDTREVFFCCFLGFFFFTREVAIVVMGSGSHDKSSSGCLIEIRES